MKHLEDCFDVLSMTYIQNDTRDSAVAEGSWISNALCWMEV